MKVLAVLGGVMSILLVVGVLAAAEVINLPGNLRTELGFAEKTPNPPCRLGIYRESPHSPKPGPGQWRFEPEAPRSAVEGSAIAIGPVIYATNGSYPGDLHRVLAYDTRTRKWSEPTQTPIGLNHSQAATYKGDLYLAGGYLDGDEPTNEFWKYDPESDEWTELPSMVKPRGAAGTAVVGDKLYVAGGAPRTFGVTAEGAPYGTFEIYDFKTGRWSAGPDMPVPRHHLVAAGLDGKLYVAGGRAGLLDTNNSVPPIGEFDRYDPETDKWERLPEMPFAAGYMGIAAAAGRIVIAGGENQTHWEDGGGWTTPSAWAFDPETNHWQRLPDLHIERRGMGAAAADGRVYVLMGSYCPGIKPTGPVGTSTVESLSFSTVRHG
ncbi:MAG TPA: kelch repeat-containing protein [Solirubrobacterales bacterium]